MINRYLAAHENFDNIGDFRLLPIHITGSKNTGVHPSEAHNAFYRLVQTYHVLEDDGYRNFWVFLELAKHQFFGEGNKRTAQLMMCGLLASQGYCPFTINTRPDHIAQALVDYYDKNSSKFYHILAEKQIKMLEPFLLEEEKKFLLDNSGLEKYTEKSKIKSKDLER